MKTQFKFPLKIISVLVIAITLIAFVGCSKNDNNDNKNNGMYNVTGNANGTQVVPSVNGSGSGSFTGTYNAKTNLLNYNMGWTGLTGSATSTAFYSGAIGANGSLIGNTAVTTNGTTGASVGTITLTDAQETALLNGGLYYLI